jgi:hypothetical protein
MMVSRADKVFTEWRNLGPHVRAQLHSLSTVSSIRKGQQGRAGWVNPNLSIPQRGAGPDIEMAEQCPHCRAWRHVGQVYCGKAVSRFIPISTAGYKI